MSDHRPYVTTVGSGGIAFIFRCSCGTALRSDNLADLDELTEIAHEHIEASEREG